MLMASKKIVKNKIVLMRCAKHVEKNCIEHIYQLGEKYDNGIFLRTLNTFISRTSQNNNTNT